MMIVNNFVKLSFYSINLGMSIILILFSFIAISGVEISKTLLSPFVITSNLSSTKNMNALPLPSFYQQIIRCCDGVAVRLSQYEEVCLVVIIIYDDDDNQ